MGENERDDIRKGVISFSLFLCCLMAHYFGSGLFCLSFYFSEKLEIAAVGFVNALSGKAAMRGGYFDTC